MPSIRDKPVLPLPRDNSAVFKLRGWWNDRILEGFPLKSDQFTEGVDFWSMPGQRWPHSVTMEALRVDFEVGTGVIDNQFNKTFRRATGHVDFYGRDQKIPVGTDVYVLKCVRCARFLQVPVSLLPL